ncbi:MAG: ATP-binding protein [Prevotella sp.]|nr:ATP-binding protein [Prevotella sp.]
MNMQLVMNMMASAAVRPLQAVADYYSRTLEQPVSLRQTLLLLQAQAAFVAAVFMDSPVPLRLLCLAWLVGSLLKCRKAFQEM